jgi:hypothetical protein
MWKDLRESDYVRACLPDQFDVVLLQIDAHQRLAGGLC